MRRIAFVLLLSLALSLASQVGFAQADDPSDLFLKAFMSAQKAEGLEREGKHKAALAKYRFAASVLDQIKEKHGEWNPLIVDYRARKTSESIAKIEEKMKMEGASLADIAATAPDDSEELPTKRTDKPRRTPPTVSVTPPERETEPVLPPDTLPLPTTPGGAAPSSDVIADATRGIRKKIEQLQGELEDSQRQYKKAQQDKQDLADRLDKALKQIDKAKQSETDLKKQLAQAQDSLKAGGKSEQARQAMQIEVNRLKNALADAEAERQVADEENEELVRRLSLSRKQVDLLVTERDKAVKDRALFAKERDEAVAQLTKVREASTKVEALLAENSSLMTKLTAAETQIKQFNEVDKPRQESEVAGLRKEVAGLKDELTSAQKKNTDFDTSMAQLKAQLDAANAQLAQIKSQGGSAEETARLTHENELLRGIVLRQMKEQARRVQAKKVIVEELAKLNAHSDVLMEQVEMLTEPLVKLTSEETSLFKDPLVTLANEANPGSVQMELAAPKTTGTDGTASVSPETSGTNMELALAKPPMDGSSSATPPGDTTALPQVETGFKANVPAELVPVAREAKEHFDNGRFREAEKLYARVLATAPNNIYALSNMAVVQFRTGKLKAAEQTLKKSIAVAPDDSFSYQTLGIVYYREGRFDDAINSLTKSLAIDPKSATAHNYLGIAASQKGWQQAAEQEMQKAIALNPQYADAHFNLAVIYATAQPPSKELAKRHYSKATELGASPDPQLEKLIR